MSKRTKIALLMAVSLFMEMLDGTIVTTALPTMSEYFGTPASTTALIISAYLITSAIFIPLSGWMANKFGKKKIWLIAAALFTLSSLANALAPTFWILLLTRVVQGMAGALMTPTARLIVLEKTPASLLLKMTSYLVWPALIAPAIAPLIGGFIVTYWNWQWVFLINVPIGIMIMIIGVRLIESDHKHDTAPFDTFGFLGVASACALVLTASELATHGSNYWFSALSLSFLGIVLGILTFNYLKKAHHPLFSISALKIPSFRVFQTGGSVFWLSVGAFPYILTIFLQTVFQWSAVKAGSYVLFIFIGNIGIKPFTNCIIRTIGYRGSLLSSFAVVFLSSIAVAFIHPDTFPVIILSLALICGMGRSLALTAYNGLCFSEVAPKNRNSANTINAVTSTLAQGLGVSLITVVVDLWQISLPAAAAYAYGFVVLGLLMIVPAIEVMFLPKNAGSNTLA